MAKCVLEIEIECIKTLIKTNKLCVNQSIESLWFDDRIGIIKPLCYLIKTQ